MTKLGEKLDQLVFNVHGAITPKLVEEARALVVAEGGDALAVEAFRDRFDSFRSRGYFDAPTRKALDAAYIELVKALPPDASGGPASVEVLSARLGTLQSLVSTRKVEITALEGKLATTEAQIGAKASQASTLLSQKQQYQQTLQQKEKQRETLLIFALFGAFGAASTAVGMGSAMSLGDLRNTIAQLDMDIAATQKDKTTLEGNLARYRAEQRTHRRELDALQAAETGLTHATADADDVDALPPEQKVLALRGRIGETQTLAENLRQQIELLQQMNASATGTSVTLDGVIGALQGDLKTLESRIEASEKALLGVVIDLVFKATGTPSSIKIGPLSLSKKVLLLDGVAGLRLSLEKQIDGLVDKMIADNLVAAGAAPELAKLLVQALHGKSTAKVTQSPTLSAMSSEAFGALSEPQRLVMDALLHDEFGGSQHEALIAKVAGKPGLTDIQARALTAMALVAPGPAGGQAEALDAVLAKGTLSRRDAARAVIDFGLATTYGAAETDETTEAHAGRLGPLSRRAISFFSSDAPAARALADGLQAYDASTRTALEDHALFRAHLLAARALATLPEASDDRIALEVLRGWRAATADRHGDGAEDRQRLDAERALAALGRLLPAGDAALAGEVPTDLAGLSARLATIETTLATRAT